MSEDPRCNRDEVLRRFGDRLRAIRRSRGISQEALAADAGFSRSYYAELETGKRNISLLNICRLAASLGVSPKDLFDSNFEEHA